jgi:hypothetical protein
LFVLVQNFYLNLNFCFLSTLALIKAQFGK